MRTPPEYAAIEAAIAARDPIRARALAKQARRDRPAGDPLHVAATRRLALLLITDFGDPAAARAVIQERLDGAPDDWASWTVLGMIEATAGRSRAAAEAAEAALRLNPRSVNALHTLIGADPAAGPARAPQIEALLAEPATPEHERRLLWSLLGRIHDRGGAHDQAHAAFVAANAIADPGYDPKAEEAALAEARRVFTPDFFAARARHGLADARMLFIVGPPRSGTTLLERALAAHPEIDGLGERPEIDQCAALVRRAAARAGHGAARDDTLGYASLAHLTESDSRVLAERYLASVRATGGSTEACVWIDKMPGNFRHLGLIRLLFPRATVLLMERDLRDVALSCHQASFAAGHGFARRVERLAHYLPQHREERRFWRAVLGDWLRPVRYEALAEDPQTILRPIVEGLGLDWDPVCLSPERSGGHAVTASKFQVRQPIHARSVARWRAYAAHLAPVIEALEAPATATAA
ncbi:MAG: sulfotransferase [Pseudomonadota bacterium]